MGTVPEEEEINWAKSLGCTNLTCLSLVCLFPYSARHHHSLQRLSRKVPFSHFSPHILQSSKVFPRSLFFYSPSRSLF
ncbi:hypothetical protein L1887_07397 [Cichorium endivia]|nr:hypothetical protein L1887_07397 [Cichorium endivia]